MQPTLFHPPLSPAIVTAMRSTLQHLSKISATAKTAALSCPRHALSPTKRTRSLSRSTTMQDPAWTPELYVDLEPTWKLASRIITHPSQLPCWDAVMRAAAQRKEDIDNDQKRATVQRKDGSDDSSNNSDQSLEKWLECHPRARTKRHLHAASSTNFTTL